MMSEISGFSTAVAGKEKHTRNCLVVDQKLLVV